MENLTQVNMLGFPDSCANTT